METEKFGCEGKREVAARGNMGPRASLFVGSVQEKVEYVCMSVTVGGIGGAGEKGD